MEGACVEGASDEGASDEEACEDIYFIEDFEMNPITRCPT